jgi:hypothetical protein
VKVSLWRCGDTPGSSVPTGWGSSKTHTKARRGRAQSMPIFLLAMWLVYELPCSIVSCIFQLEYCKHIAYMQLFPLSAQLQRDCYRPSLFLLVTLSSLSLQWRLFLLINTSKLLGTTTYLIYIVQDLHVAPIFQIKLIKILYRP